MTPSEFIATYRKYCCGSKESGFVLVGEWWVCVACERPYVKFGSSLKPSKEKNA